MGADADTSRAGGPPTAARPEPELGCSSPSPGYRVRFEEQVAPLPVQMQSPLPPCEPLILAAAPGLQQGAADPRGSAQRKDELRPPRKQRPETGAEAEMRPSGIAGLHRPQGPARRPQLCPLASWAPTHNSRGVAALPTYAPAGRRMHRPRFCPDFAPIEDPRPESETPSPPQHPHQ